MTINGHMKTECLNKPIFEFVSMKANGKDWNSIVFIVNSSCVGSNSQDCFVYKGVTAFRVIL